MKKETDKKNPPELYDGDETEGGKATNEMKNFMRFVAIILPILIILISNLYVLYILLTDAGAQ